LFDVQVSFSFTRSQLLKLESRLSETFGFSDALMSPDLAPGEVIPNSRLSR